MRILNRVVCRKNKREDFLNQKKIFLAKLAQGQFLNLIVFYIEYFL